jgi:hypothetical protein
MVGISVKQKMELRYRKNKNAVLNQDGIHLKSGCDIYLHVTHYA